MSKSFLASVMVAVLAVPVMAADLPPLPVKIPPPQPTFTCGTTQTCIGPYVGVDVSGLSANFTSVVPGAAGGINSGDITFGVHGGFEYWNGTYFAAVELGVRDDLTQNMNALGGINKSAFTFFEVVKVGANLQGLFGIPTTTAPAATSASGALAGIPIPANFLNMLTSAYVQGGAAQRFGQTGSVAGAGLQVLLASNWTAEVDYKRITWNGAQASPTLSLNTEDVLSAGVSYHFK